MAPTNYQKQLGPRWYVTNREKDSNGNFPPNIAIDDALSFEGDGSSPTSKLFNITQNVVWGEECKHPHPDVTRTNRANELEMKRPSTRNVWIITRSKLPSPSDRYQIKAEPSSGGGSWTATEG